MEPADIRLWVKTLEKGQEFVDEYEKLCRKYNLFIDPGCGAEEVVYATKRTISEHVKKLRSSIVEEISLYNNVLFDGTREV